MSINLLIEKYNKNELRILVLAYLFSKNNIRGIETLLSNISEDSKTFILEELGRIKINKSIYFDEIDADTIKFLLEGKSYNKLESERCKFIQNSIITTIVTFIAIMGIIYKFNLTGMQTIFFSLFLMVPTILSYYPIAKNSRYLYIKRSLEKVKSSLMGKDSEDISLKDSILDELRKSDSILIKNIELQELKNKIDKPIIEIESIKKTIKNGTNFINFNQIQKDAYELELISCFSIKSNRINEILNDKEKSCPTIFFNMNKIVDIYNRNYPKKDTKWNKLKLEYEKLLKMLVNELFKNNEYSIIGNIIYQEYSTNSFHIFDIFYNVCSKENWIEDILDDRNKNRDDFIKNIPTMLIFSEKLVNKSNYQLRKDKFRKLRASIPLHIYNRAYRLMAGA